MRFWIAIVALALAAFFGEGCSLPRPAPKWVGGELKASSERVLWEATRLALQKNNFPVGAGMDEAHLQALSGYVHSLAPFRGKGFRERCYVNWTSLGEGKWHLDVRVERDRNDDISHPLDISYADWQPDPDNEDRARLVAQYIRSLLDTR
jgi:hypothetical protein